MNHKGFGLLESLIIILIIAVVGFGGYYSLSKNAGSKSINSEITDVSTQNEDIVTDEETNLEIASKNNEDFLPVVQFVPDTFTEQEKAELRAKVVEPYVAYAEETNGDTIVSVMIEDLINGSMDNEYEYEITTISKNGYSYFLHTLKGEPIDYYLPDCYMECIFSAEIREKYPDFVANANKEIE